MSGGGEEGGRGGGVVPGEDLLYLRRGWAIKLEGGRSRTSLFVPEVLYTRTAVPPASFRGTGQRDKPAVGESTCQREKAHRWANMWGDDQSRENVQDKSVPGTS